MLGSSNHWCLDEDMASVIDAAVSTFPLHVPPEAEQDANAINMLTRLPPTVPHAVLTEDDIIFKTLTASYEVLKVLRIGGANNTRFQRCIRLHGWTYVEFCRVFKVYMSCPGLRGGVQAYRGPQSVEEARHSVNGTYTEWRTLFVGDVLAKWCSFHNH